jgi:signal peptidase I
MLKRLGTFFLDILEVVVFAIAIFLFIYLLLFQPHKIKGASMSPTFPDGEYLLTDKVTYRMREPQRGDVIVFKARVAQGEEFIKRIIGLPGESVSIKNGKIFINNIALNENVYLDSGIITSGSAFLQDEISIIVPKDEYFVLGDNRPHSSDSRSWGFVTKKEISGRAWLVYWPPKNAGVVSKIKYNF